MILVSRWRMFVASLVLAPALASSLACATPRGRVYVRVGPPAPLVEARVVAPGPGYVWIPGYHVWNGAAYVWTPGRWERPARARARWVPGHWVRDRHGWCFVEGRWR
jgi:WXXGXW repeat (2 copies)